MKSPIKETAELLREIARDAEVNRRRSDRDGTPGPTEEDVTRLRYQASEAERLARVEGEARPIEEERWGRPV